MSNAWSHLPNAHHIDWVLKSLEENPELWTAAWDADWSAAWYAARSAARNAAWYAARSAARNAAWSAAMSAARNAARCSIEALIAYDDCDNFLNMSYEKLKVWAVLSEDPKAVLLLPMVYVKEQLAQEAII